MPSPLDQPELPTPIQTPQSDLVPTQPLATESSDTGAITAAEEARGAPDGQGEEVHTLDIGEGNIVKLDKLGPMIINSDGTLSRIHNWQDLHPIEQERTVRLLVKKRNLVRLRQLDAENPASSGEEERLTALQGGS